MMLTLIRISLFLPFVLGTEFTFELLNSEKQCFYEDMEMGVKFEIDYQVIAGGNYDVDCFVTDPQNNLLYNGRKRQSDSISSTTVIKGIYQVCFSSESSVFTHKKVYLRFRYGEEPPLFSETYNRITALTQMGFSCVSIHKLLEDSSKSLAWSKLREARDRTKAERLLDRVTYWFIGETTLLVVIVIVQVMTLKSVSNEKLSDDLDDSELLLKPANPEISSSSETLKRHKESITPAALWRQYKGCNKKQKRGIGIQSRLAAKPYRVSVIVLPDAHSLENKMDHICELHSRRSVFKLLPSWKRLRNSRARSSQLKSSFIFQTGDRKPNSQPPCASMNQET